MWNVIPLTSTLFVFQSEHDYPQDWTASANITETEGNRLNVKIDICLTLIRDKEAYEQLLDAIRHFADQQVKHFGKTDCLLQYQCTGILDGVAGIDIPSIEGTDGSRLAHAFYTEQRMSG